MKKIKLYYGYHPEYTIEYHGEQLFQVIEVREKKKRIMRMNNGAWVTDEGNEKYHSDWTQEERWVRVEEQIWDDETNELKEKNTLGYMIWKVDRSKNLL